MWWLTTRTSTPLPVPATRIQRMTKSITQFEGSPSALGKWEDAGKSLAKALSTYLSSCMFLETFSSKNGVDSQHLAARIDISLNTLHIKLSEELAQSRIVLARMRNKTLSRFYSLPNEVVAAIFVDVVYAPAPEDKWNPSMAEALKIMLGRLHKLLSICSSWREFGIALKELWSVVPMAANDRGHTTREATSLILERSRTSFKDRPLHLAAILSHTYDSYVPLLGGQVPQFTSINIECRFIGIISSLIEGLLRHRPSLAISELSIHQVRDERDQIPPRIPPRHEYLTSNMSANHGLAMRLIGSLSTLRVRGANVPWDKIIFTSKLVELRLQSVVLGDHSKLINFLQVLQSASELQHLDIISIVTIEDNLDPLDTPVSSIYYPRLQSLLLEDLPLDVLQILLSSILPGSYRTKLFLTPQSQLIYEPNDFVAEVDGQPLYELLERSRVDTLLLRGDTMWLNNTRLRRILQSLPTIKTLKMTCWELRTQDLRALERPQPATSNPEPFPSLDNLYINNSKIWDTEALSRVVTSHPLQSMQLGGNTLVRSGDNDQNITGPHRGWDWFKSDDPIVERLKTIVPHFQLLKEFSEIEDFRQDVWKLW